ncbi:MAG: sigma-70 family RNA polymerase sigma factor [Chloroflexota bacterium]|nr:sigma-70 family RNA polymerase sigma factor [Chloroflexota bacterium]
MEESEAISRLKRGDIGGLESLVMLYQGQALRVAYLTTRDYALAEDVVQASFLRAYERIAQFDSSKRFGPWFIRSVINNSITAVRSRPGQYLELEADDEFDLPSPDPSLVEMLEMAEIKSEILSALDKLPPKERAAIVMRYYLDWDDAEVSQRLLIPAGTVRRRLHDARRRLRRLLPSYRQG